MSGIDYEMVLTIIVNSDDPARDLRAFVEQEREDAAHKAVTAALNEAATELRARAALEFDARGFTDVRGAAIWDSGCWLDEVFTPARTNGKEGSL